MSSNITKSNHAIANPLHEGYDLIHARIPRQMFIETLGVEPDLNLAFNVITKYVMPNFVDFRLDRVTFNADKDVCVIIQRKTNFKIHEQAKVAYIGAPQGLMLQMQQMKIEGA